MHERNRRCRHTPRALLAGPTPSPTSQGTKCPKSRTPPHQKGDFLVDYEEKVFEDVKAEPGEKALVTFHTVAFEGSIGLVNLLQATRLLRKGFETSVLLYGPGVTLGVQRGFPTLGDEAFPGHRLQQPDREVHGGRRQGLRLPLRAAGAVRARRSRR